MTDSGRKLELSQGTHYIISQGDSDLMGFEDYENKHKKGRESKNRESQTINDMEAKRSKILEQIQKQEEESAEIIQRCQLQAQQLKYKQQYEKIVMVQRIENQTRLKKEILNLKKVSEINLAIIYETKLERDMLRFKIRQKDLQLKDAQALKQQKDSIINKHVQVIAQMHAQKASLREKLAIETKRCSQLMMDLESIQKDNVEKLQKAEDQKAGLREELIIETKKCIQLIKSMQKESQDFDAIFKEYKKETENVLKCFQLEKNALEKQSDKYKRQYERLYEALWTVRTDIDHLLN